jgi:hypothetical protein
MRLAFVLVILTLEGFQCLTAQSTYVQGLVFNDENRNGHHDAQEHGIAGVLVSNQREVVKTDAQGKYTLPARSNMIIFITKPSGYTVPLNDYNQPGFFYIHQPVGSPGTLKYQGLEPTGELPEAVNFALYRAADEDDFKAIIVGDPQPRNIQELGYYRDDIVSEMINRKASFYIAYGDIAFDDLSLYEEYNQIVGTLGLPAYNVHGNHDMNYDVPHDSLASETFKRYFGPADYSFNYGKVHFIVLDNVRYSGWDYENNKKGSYVGHLSNRQINWLRNDLLHTPEDYLIVINTHIPLHTPKSDAGSVNTVNKAALFKVLENRRHLLALSAHMHYIDHLEFESQHGWQGDAVFPQINVGAGCGAWWSGPKDTRGIPVTYSLDGSPNGFYVFSFNGNSFNHRYIPADAPEHEQMRISFPSGRIKRDALINKNIMVNVFNADPHATVVCSIDNGPSQPMHQQTGQDPFIVEYLKDGTNFPEWSNRAETHRHMWTLPFPQNLEVGTHTIRIKATDSRNNTYHDFAIFSVY